MVDIPRLLDVLSSTPGTRQNEKLQGAAIISRAYARHIQTTYFWPATFSAMVVFCRVGLATDM
jgi:hypothetical protein